MDVIVLADGATEQTALVRRAVVLRARCAAPVLVVGPDSWNTEDRARALLGGADDVVTRPGSAPAEFLARLGALARRSHPTQQQVVRIGRLEIDLAADRIGGRFVTLTRDQRNIISALAARAPGVVTYVELAHALGYDRAFSARAVREAVRRLRVATVGTGLRIETVFGVGYRAWDR